MSYYDKIDPIGESKEKEVKELSEKEKLEADICNLNTSIQELNNEIAYFRGLIDGHRIYSDDVYHRGQLKMFCQRLKNNLKQLESSRDGIVGFINVFVEQ